MHLTKRTIDAARHPGGRKWLVLWDDAPKGMGCRVYPSGEKAFVLRYRRAGKTCLVTLGRYGDDLTLAQARDEAVERRRLARRGVDLRARQRQEAETFASAAAQWLADDQAGNRRRSRAEAARIINNHCKPLAGVRLREITKAHVLALLRDTRDGVTPISRKPAPCMSNRVLAALRRFFRWCVEQDKLPASPIATVRPLAREVSRTRVLSDTELAYVWKCAGPYPYGPMVKLLILTGCRRQEAAGMSWHEVEGDTWTIPGARAKNGKPHRIPLTAQALELLAGLPRMEGSDFVFSASGRGPFSDFSGAKAELVGRIAEAAARDGRKLAPFVLHDLRRSTASGLARAGIQPIVISALLNHAPARLLGITAVYARHDYASERRRALEMWARHLERVVAGEGGDAVVVPLAAARAG
jgi:integrase